MRQFEEQPGGLGLGVGAQERLDAIEAVLERVAVHEEVACRGRERQPRRVELCDASDLGLSKACGVAVLEPEVVSGERRRGLGRRLSPREPCQGGNGRRKNQDPFPTFCAAVRLLRHNGPRGGKCCRDLRC